MRERFIKIISYLISCAFSVIMILLMTAFVLWLQGDEPEWFRLVITVMAQLSITIISVFAVIHTGVLLVEPLFKRKSK